MLPTLLLSAVEIPHHHGYQLPGPAVPALTLIPQTLPPSGPIYHNHQTPMPLQATSPMHMWLPLPPSLFSQGLDESSSFEGPPAGPPPTVGQPLLLAPQHGSLFPAHWEELLGDRGQV